MPRTKAGKPKAPLTTAQRLGSLLKSARDTMRKDKGLNGDLDRLPMLTWLMFLKFLDDHESLREEKAKLGRQKYRPAIEPPYRWRDWAAPADGLTGPDLMKFINNEETKLPDGSKGDGLLAHLRAFSGSEDDRQRVIGEVFAGVTNRMDSGYLLRDIINKVNGIHFQSTDEIHTLGHLYESMLKEMRDAAGDSGEFYTPRAIVRLIVAATDPRLGETVLDPACGTGGFLVEAYQHLKKQYDSVKQGRMFHERTVIGHEAKSLPYMLCQMNLLLHGMESPNVRRINSLGQKLSEIKDGERVDVILTNPPFGGEEHMKGIQSNFPADKQTSETALLFLQLIMRKLKVAPKPGRAAVVVPNGTLFGDGVCAKIKQELLTKFNLHTVVRLPNGVFAPYTSIPTNILFFDRTGPTKDIWYYEHPLPEGRKPVHEDGPDPVRGVRQLPAVVARAPGKRSGLARAVRGRARGGPAEGDPALGGGRRGRGEGPRPARIRGRGGRANRRPGEGVPGERAGEVSRQAAQSTAGPAGGALGRGASAAGRSPRAEVGRGRPVLAGVQPGPQEPSREGGLRAPAAGATGRRHPEEGATDRGDHAGDQGLAREAAMSKWPLVRLGDLLFKSEEWVTIHPNRKYKEVTVRLWGNGATLRREVEGSGIAATSRIQVHTDQFIISRIDARNGASGLIPADLEGAVVSTDFPAFSPRAERLLPKYLHWLSRTKGFVELCQRASEGTTNRVRLKEDRFLATAIPLPPLAEQRRLVERIDALAAKIEEAKRLRGDADQASVALSFAPFTALPQPGSATPSGTLGDYVENHDSGWSPQCGDVPATDSEWGVLKTTCVQWRGFDRTQNKVLLPGMRQRREITVQRGDVLITRAGPVNRVGIACCVEQAEPRLMLSDKIVRLRPNPGLIPHFLVAYFATPFAQDYFRHGKTGLAESQVNISREKLLRLPVVVPSVEQQQRFVAHLRTIRDALGAVQKERELVAKELNALLLAILDRAFKGEL
jgi:type I restriction enzyme M protein